MSITHTSPGLRGTWLENDVRQLLGVFGRNAHIYNVYSVGDSGEGCEVIEFTTRTSAGIVPYTARVSFEQKRAITVCTLGW